MSLIIRQSLVSRLQQLPALKAMLDDLSDATGLPVRFLPSTGARVDDAPETPHSALCAWLARDPAGCRHCLHFRQKLRDDAAHAPAVATCDAGLWEALVPVRIGGHTAGHLCLFGCAEEAATTANQNRARHLLGRAGVKLPMAEFTALRSQAPVVPARRRAALVRLMQLAADRIALLLTEHYVTAPHALPPVVAKACALVHVEFASELSLSGLARQLDVSEGHFSRIFHHATGLRFVEYLARYRAERARALILSTHEPVAEIAAACGFRSLSQFNRVFRAAYATTPRSLRNAPLKMHQTDASEINAPK